MNALHKARADSDLQPFLIQSITWFRTPIWVEGKRGIDKHGKSIIWKSSLTIEPGEPTIASPNGSQTDQETEDEQESSTSVSEDEEMNSDHESRTADSNHDGVKVGKSQTHEDNGEGSGNYKLII